MHYDAFRTEGYVTGSGAVEMACKHVVSKRLKQSAMNLEENRLISDISFAGHLPERWQSLLAQHPSAA